jgi:uncharacterized protein YprB with RNaseH-like and TPR domain
LLIFTDHAQPQIALFPCGNNIIAPRKKKGFLSTSTGRLEIHSSWIILVKDEVNNYMTWRIKNLIWKIKGCSAACLHYLKKKSLSQKVMHTYDGDIFDVPYTRCKTEKIKCLYGGHVPPFPHLLECQFHYHKTLIID